MAFIKNVLLTNMIVAGSLITGSVHAAAYPIQIAQHEKSLSDWKQFTSSKSGFNIDFPSEPEHIEQTIEIPQTDLKISYNTFLSEPTDSVVYVVSVWDYPKEIDMSDPKQNLQDGFGGMLSALPNAKVQFMEAGMTQDFHSLEFIVLSEDIVFRGKLILVNHTLFQAFTVYRSGENMDENYRHFIESLDFTQHSKESQEEEGAAKKVNQFKKI